MPDDVAIEKVQVLEKLGAKVERVRPGRIQFCDARPMLMTDSASIVDEKQFVVSNLTLSLSAFS